MVISVISGKTGDDTRAALRSVLEAKLPERLRVKDALSVLVTDISEIDYEDEATLTQWEASRMVNDVGLEIFRQPSKDSGGYLYLVSEVLFLKAYPHLASAVPVLLACEGVRLSGKPGRLPPSAISPPLAVAPVTRAESEPGDIRTARLKRMVRAGEDPAIDVLGLDLRDGWVESTDIGLIFLSEDLRRKVARIFTAHGLPPAPGSSFELFGNRSYILRLVSKLSSLRDNRKHPPTAKARAAAEKMEAAYATTWYRRDKHIMEKLAALDAGDTGQLRVIHEEEGRSEINAALYRGYEQAPAHAAPVQAEPEPEVLTLRPVLTLTCVKWSTTDQIPTAPVPVPAPAQPKAH